MKFRPIFVDSNLQELTEHGTADFPMSMDEQQVSLEHCGQVLHWHYEIQIAVVTKGSILFKTSDSEFLVRCGQGIFFNSGCLHEAISTEDQN
ncbi:MAG: AraC family ligand binding domain-containing protein, partial [Synergistaceae bacterium]|nr:AraC family ligand binding domain-containing protein [Synergistaceae bacterium]